MNKKQISQYIMVALEVLKSSKITSDNAVDKKIVSKVASFGPTVLSMGLKPTVAMFSKANDEAERKPVVDMIFEVLKRCHPDMIEKKKDLLDCVRDAEDKQLRQLKERILAISIALKLALRTYPEK